MWQALFSSMGVSVAYFCFLHNYISIITIASFGIVQKSNFSKLAKYFSKPAS